MLRFWFPWFYSPNCRDSLYWGLLSVLWWLSWLKKNPVGVVVLILQNIQIQRMWNQNFLLFSNSKEFLSAPVCNPNSSSLKGSIQCLEICFWRRKILNKQRRPALWASDTETFFSNFPTFVVTAVGCWHAGCWLRSCSHCSPNRSSSVSTSENFIWDQPKM